LAQICLVVFEKKNNVKTVQLKNDGTEPKDKARLLW